MEFQHPSACPWPAAAACPRALGPVVLSVPRIPAETGLSPPGKGVVLPKADTPPRRAGPCRC